MCGISTILTLQGHKPLDHGVKGGLVNRLRESLDMIKHRGPDSRGEWISPDSRVALGHVRLEINDLTPTGCQPLHSTTQKIHAVVNGEIYDYDRLRKDMEDKLDYRFNGTSDCELVLALYEYYGISFLSHLRGEFALVLYDEDRQIFLAVRDRYGIKPLFWTVQNGQLLIAAEMKAFLPLGWKPEWDMRSIVDGGYQIGSATFFKDVQKVRPGHYLLCRSNGNVEENIYWDMTYADKDLCDNRTEKEMIEGVRSRLKDAIRERLRADVKVGVSLSGGIDSSVVAGMVCEMIKEGEAVGGDKLSDRLTCFGIAFDEESGFDESAFANRTADFLGVKFYKKDMNEQALAERFEDATWICEQPCPDLNFIGCYALSELVREQGYRVLINGQGSDEIFGGYPLFLPEYLREPDLTTASFYMPEAQHQTEALKADQDGPSYPSGPNNLRTLHQLNSTLAAQRISSAYPPHPYPSTVLNHVPIPDPAQTYAETLSVHTQHLMNTTWHPLHTSLYLFCKSNLETLLLCNLGDRGEMAHSIEGRTPFLDHHLTEYVNSLPPSMKIRPVPKSTPKRKFSSPEPPIQYEYIGKYILREASRPYITDEIYRKQKHPYSAPVRWPKNGPLYDVISKLVTKERVEKLGWIDYEGGKVGKMVERAFDEEGGDKEAYALVLMIAQWVVVGERFGVVTWTPGS